VPAPHADKRLAGLDGIRGLAALYVVINHVFLRAFPGYPVDHAPWSQTASVPRPRAERVAR
jgi:peptidoglycan/LPS O-acetylase OafA/YrhL